MRVTRLVETACLEERRPLKAVLHRRAQPASLAGAGQRPQQDAHAFEAELSPVDVGYGEGKSGPRQQVAQRLYIGERRHPQCGPAGGGCFGLQQDLSEFTQRFLRGKRSQEQPARAENATNLDEGAGQVVHPMQRQRRQHRLKGFGGEGKEFLVADDGFGWRADRADGVRGEDCQVIDPGVTAYSVDQRAVPRTQQ